MLDVTGKKQVALQNIMALENEPVPLYSVSEKKDIL